MAGWESGRKKKKIKKNMEIWWEVGDSVNRWRQGLELIERGGGVGISGGAGGDGTIMPIYSNRIHKKLSNKYQLSILVPDTYLTLVDLLYNVSMQLDLRDLSSIWHIK